ncbi:MAG: YezD family protein [Sedimentisphaerales bacterium]|nr:YezD family protein [Sedimentisphaerales bacterium]
MNEKKSSNESAINDAIIRDIRKAIAGLDYGTVTIKVHNSKIVQIEITQKKRFDDAGLVEKGGGI